MKTAVLLLTWFYAVQSPSQSQTQFTSMEACQLARDAILRDVARLKAEADEVTRTAPGTITAPATPRGAIAESW